MPARNKMLIVDDSPLFRLNTKNMLQNSFSLEMHEASSIREMLQFLLYHPVEDIALIILDLNLPDGNGLKALQNYKEKFQVHWLPFIVVSTGIRKDIIPLALKYGARDVLTKPVNPYDFMKRVEQILTGDPAYRAGEKEPAETHLEEDRQPIMDYYDPIRKEIKRAKRGKYPFSMMMLSLLPRGRETFMVGEGVDSKLYQGRLSSQIEPLLRETDDIIDLSSNELLLLLPFADYQGSVVVKEKIEKELLPAGQQEQKMALSASSVSFPDHGENPDDLIVKLEADFKSQNLEDA